MGPTTQPSVLVVDDDLQILQLIEIVLSRAGLTVEAVSNGSVANDRLAETDYAAIVLDLTMPLISGFEVLSRLKRIKPQMLSRVVVITAMTDTGVRRLNRSLIYSVVSKPFDIAKMTETVKKCIGDHEQPIEAIPERVPIKTTPPASTDPAPPADDSPPPKTVDTR